MITLTVGLVAALVVVSLGARAGRPAARRADDDGPRPSRRPAATRPMVELLERSSRDVRSGAALRTALIDALDHDPTTLPALRARLARGDSLVGALADVAPRNADDRVMVHALQLAATTGGSVADTLERVVAVMRERQAWRDERSSHAAQARLSARMLTMLPIAVALWGVVSSPSVRHVYATSPAAAVATGLGVLLNLIGWSWMRHLVRGPRTA
jgi:tight adherence protein B